MFDAIKPLLIYCILFVLPCRAGAPKINEYVVTKAFSAIIIDGRLLESDWNKARWTETFVFYADGSEPVFTTQTKMLWDDKFLFIAFLCQDDDVWATHLERDQTLWHEEVVEVYCDPDGDGLNYLELQINPLGTVLDLLMDRAYSTGGSADHTFELTKLKVAVSVDGTINDLDNTDVKWICEVALPFQNLADIAPGMNFPPIDGDTWRLNLCRYERQRTGKKITEITSWNPSYEKGFHVPEKFGCIVFSDNAPEYYY